MLTDILIVLILILIVGAAGFYVYKAKKSGKKCIGCPDSGSCGGSCAGCTKCSGCGKTE